MKKNIQPSNNFHSKYTFMKHRIFTRTNLLRIAFSLAIMNIAASPAFAQSKAKVSDAQIEAVNSAGSGSIPFIENKGQWPDHIIYRADIPGYQMLATPEGMLIGKFNTDDLGALTAYEDKMEEISKGLSGNDQG